MIQILNGIASEWGELFLLDAHIKPYENGSWGNHEPLRPRKLLLHRRELSRLQISLERKGLTLVPLDLYLKKGLVKVTVGLGRGKKLHDKRHSLKKEDARRTIERALGRR